MADYTLRLTENEGKALEKQAAERGYQSVADYVRALISADALVEALRDDWQDADESPEVLEAGLRQSWHEIMTGQTYPISELKAMLDEDDEQT